MTAALALGDRSFQRFLATTAFLSGNGRSLPRYPLPAVRPEVFRGNPWIWRMAGAMIALQLIFTYAPFMHTWFHSAPITIRGWSVAIALSIAIFLIIETAKWVGRRFMPALVT
ncbi:cation transporting ATPase C-terminal domain-containing protein [Mycolicibacterium nivoides]|uniref:Cation transporting ATPase C-terminal domain-containing protein n=1 Tax=Mycolicibacterium nivoides TaxID=2487344 RepID=A0ABW9L955_9MYCO